MVNNQVRLSTNVVTPGTDDLKKKSAPGKRKPLGDLGTIQAKSKENVPPRDFGAFKSSQRSIKSPDAIIPFEDPLKVNSAAKNPVVGPPKSVNPSQDAPQHAPSFLAWKKPLDVPRVRLQTLMEKSTVKLEKLGPDTKVQDKPVPTPERATSSFSDVVRAHMNGESRNIPASSNGNVQEGSAGFHGHTLFNKLKSIVAKKGKASTKKAEDTLRRAITSYAQGKVNFRPDGACFNAVIHAYAEQGDPTSAEAVLRLMFEDYYNGNLTAEPNVRVYTNVLHAWRKSEDPMALSRIESILSDMDSKFTKRGLRNCRPDKFAYTVAFHCLADTNNPSVAEDADRLLAIMKRQYEEGNQELKTDHVMFTNVLNIFVSNPKTHDRAEGYLWSMIDEFKEGNHSLKLNIRNFNTVVAMWSKSPVPDAALRAQAMVTRLLKMNESNELNLAPDEFTYALLLKTWANSGTGESLEQTVKLFRWMKQLHAKGDQQACPDLIKYSTCINALAKGGDAKQAEALLEEMRMSFLTGNYEAQPDHRLYTTVIVAWTSQKSVGFGQRVRISRRADALLAKMWSLHHSGAFKNIQPTVHTYNHVIGYMKLAGRPDRAEDLLIEFNKYHFRGLFKKRAPPNMYRIVIQAWEGSRDEDRERHIAALAREMRKTGR